MDEYEYYMENNENIKIGLKKKIKPRAGISVENRKFLTFEPATSALPRQCFWLISLNII